MIKRLVKSTTNLLVDVPGFDQHGNELADLDVAVGRHAHQPENEIS
jgi:hypothetical protein